MQVGKWKRYYSGFIQGFITDAKNKVRADVKFDDGERLGIKLHDLRMCKTLMVCVEKNGGGDAAAAGAAGAGGEAAAPPPQYFQVDLGPDDTFADLLNKVRELFKIPAEVESIELTAESGAPVSDLASVLLSKHCARTTVSFEAPKPAGPWACSTCTLENEPAATACMACGKSRPARAASKSLGGGRMGRAHESERKMPEAVAEKDIANLGEKQHIKYMLDDYKFNTSLVDKITNLAGDYLSFRSARGDGNCYYRAVSCAWYEYLMGEPADRAAFVANLDGWQLPTEYMIKQKTAARDLLLEMGAIADDPTRGADAARAELEERLLKDGVSDRAVVETFRFVASQYIKENPTLETPSGMTIETFIMAMDGQMTTEQYCKEVVEQWGEDARDAVHIALPVALGIQVRIVYLDRSEGNDLMKIDFPSKEGEAVRPFQVSVLLKPGHYDILYPMPNGMQGYIVNHKMGDRVMVFYPKLQECYGGVITEVKLMDDKPLDAPQDEKVEYVITFDDGDVTCWPQKSVEVCDESKIKVVAAPQPVVQNNYGGYGYDGRAQSGGQGNYAEQGGYGVQGGGYGVAANPPAGINYHPHPPAGPPPGHAGYQGVSPGGGGGRGGEQQQQQAEMMNVGDRIKVFYDKYKRWYPGTVEQIVQPGGEGAPQYGIQFDDGERTAHIMERCRPLLGLLPSARTPTYYQVVSVYTPFIVT